MVQKFLKKGEVQPNEIMDAFKEQYLSLQEPFKLISISISDINSDTEKTTKVNAVINYKGEEREIEGIGNGPIDSLGKALSNSKLIDVSIIDYKEHALSTGSEAEAAAYVYMGRNVLTKRHLKVEVDSNITRASIKSIISALNRLYGSK